MAKRTTPRQNPKIHNTHENSSFNILPVHHTLVEPTRERMKVVIGVSAACTLVMYLAIAAFGYMYALDGTLVRAYGWFWESVCIFSCLC